MLDIALRSVHKQQVVCHTECSISAMTQLGEAIARYHKLLENEPFRNSGWTTQLRDQMGARRLIINGRPVSPVLRPHFLSRRQYTNLARLAETLGSAIERIRTMALSTPALLHRMELLPAEKMLASVDPGYPYPAVASLFDTQVNNGSVYFTDCRTDLPTGIVFGEVLSDLYFDTPVVKEFRKKYKLEKVSASKPLISAMLKAYKEFGGGKHPNIAIIEFKQPFQTEDTQEFLLLVELFRKHGYNAEIVSADQLEYRNGVLKRGDYNIDLVYRGVRAKEFLLRFDLNHPLVRAYRERKVCVVNSFRSELTRKMALFDLLTDDTITASFPQAEKKAIRESIPWTRLVTSSKTSYKDETVDLPEFILQNRERLVLRPNELSSEQQSFAGAYTDESSWERAVKLALRQPYVVQERLESHPIPFPVDFYGDIVMRDLNVDVHPHEFLGKVHGVSSRISSADASRFSTISGYAPTYILESK